MLYDQLTQYTKKELFVGVQMGGLNRVKSGVLAEGDGVRTSRPESVDATRGRRNHGLTGRTISKLEKTAYLKDQTVVSILIDFVRDEVQQDLHEA